MMLLILASELRVCCALCSSFTNVRVVFMMVVLQFDFLSRDSSGSEVASVYGQSSFR